MTRHGLDPTRTLPFAPPTKSGLRTKSRTDFGMGTRGPPPTEYAGPPPGSGLMSNSTTTAQTRPSPLRRESPQVQAPAYVQRVPKPKEVRQQTADLVDSLTSQGKTAEQILQILTGQRTLPTAAPPLELATPKKRRRPSRWDLTPPPGPNLPGGQNMSKGSPM